MGALRNVSNSCLALRLAVHMSDECIIRMQSPISVANSCGHKMPAYAQAVVKVSQNNFFVNMSPFYSQ